MPRGRSSSRTLIILAIIAAVSGWGTATLTNWEKIFPHEVSPEEELEFQGQVSQVLYGNKSINALYLEFRRQEDENTSIADYFRMWEHVRDSKQEFRTRLAELHPTPRFARLYQILLESLQSDARLMELEEESFRHTLGALAMFDSFGVDTTRLNDPSLSEDERKGYAAEELYQLWMANREWLDKANELNAAMQSARATSITALRLLNEELDRLGLPYEHDDPFSYEKSFSPERSSP